MNWYMKLEKLASPSLYEPHRLAPGQKATRFFNFLKSQNIRIDLFHGTSQKKWDLAQQKGYLLAPSASGLPDNENRKQDAIEEEKKYPGEGVANAENNYGLDQIFFTALPKYAQGYAERQAINDRSTGLILKVSFPLYAIAEVQAAIFDQKDKVYNEQWKQNAVEEVIQSDWPNPMKAELIVTELKKHFMQINEITVRYAVPVKWVVSADEISKPSRSYNHTLQQKAPQLKKPPIETPETDGWTPPEPAMYDETPW